MIPFLMRFRSTDGQKGGVVVDLLRIGTGGPELYVDWCVELAGPRGVPLPTREKKTLRVLGNFMATLRSFPVVLGVWGHQKWTLQHFLRRHSTPKHF